MQFQPSVGLTPDCTFSVPQKEPTVSATGPENVPENPFPSEAPTALDPDAPLWPHSPIAPSERFEREVRQKRALLQTQDKDRTLLSGVPEGEDDDA